MKKLEAQAAKETDKSEALLKRVREQASKCPKCGELVLKGSGCNHMQCPKCKVHYCHACSNFSSEDQDEVYRHMDTCEVSRGYGFDFGLTTVA